MTLPPDESNSGYPQSGRERILVPQPIAALGTGAHRWRTLIWPNNFL